MAAQDYQEKYLHRVCFCVNLVVLVLVSDVDEYARLQLCAIHGNADHRQRAVDALHQQQ